MVKTPLPPGTMLEVHFSVRRSVSKLALRSCINTTPTLFPGGWVFLPVPVSLGVRKNQR